MRKTLFFLLTLPFLFSCSMQQKQPPKGRVKVGVLPAEIAFPLAVAKDKNLFEKNGWQAELLTFQSAAELFQAFQAKEVDMVLADIVSCQLMLEAGADVQALGLIRGSVPFEGRIAILSAPGSEILSLSDLKSKGVALSQNTHAEYVLDMLLKKQNLEPGLVHKVKIPKIPIRYSLLMSQKIPAAVLPEPMATLAQRNGAFLLKDDSEENLSQIILVAHREFVERESSKLPELMQAYDQAVEQINQDKESFRSIYLQTCTIPEALRESYPIRDFSPIKPVPYGKWESVKQWLSEKKLLEKSIDFEHVTTSEYLQPLTPKG